MKKKTMLDISLEAADTIYSYASIIAIAAAFISAGAGVLTYMASSVQARYSDELIAKANSVSAEANNAAAQANAKTEILTHQNLELQIKLEKEKKERLELQRSVERRRISEKQKKEVIDASNKIQKKLKIKLQCNQKDFEALTYLEQIGQMLHDQGHYAHGIGTGIIVQMGSANVGVYLIIFDTPQKNDVLMLLGLTGIATELVQLTRSDPDGFHAELTVLPKPPYIV